MKISLSCKRPGASTEAFIIEWNEPEAKALDTYAHFYKSLKSMLEAHGLMK